MYSTYAYARRGCREDRRAQHNDHQLSSRQKNDMILKSGGYDVFRRAVLRNRIQKQRIQGIRYRIEGRKRQERERVPNDPCRRQCLLTVPRSAGCEMTGISLGLTVIYYHIRAII